MREFIINFFAVFGVICAAFIVYAIIDTAVGDFKEKRKLRCKNCGNLYRFSDNFCRKCGKSLREQIGGESDEK